jgi:hypothetical protein
MSLCRVVALVLAMVAIRSTAATTRGDPFAFWEPTITLTEADRRQLERGEPVHAGRLQPEAHRAGNDATPARAKGGWD